MTAALAILSALQKPKSEPEKDSINEDMETEVELSSESVDEEDMERLWAYCPDVLRAALDGGARLDVPDADGETVEGETRVPMGVASAPSLRISAS